MWVRGVQSLLSWKGGARSLSGYFRRGFNPCYLGRATASGTRLGRRRAIAYFNPCSGGCFSAIQFFVAICHKDAPRGETERGLALARWRFLRSPRFLRPPSSRPVRITRAREVLSIPDTHNVSYGVRHATRPQEVLFKGSSWSPLGDRFSGQRVAVGRRKKACRASNRRAEGGAGLVSARPALGGEGRSPLCRGRGPGTERSTMLCFIISCSQPSPRIG